MYKHTPIITFFAIIIILALFFLSLSKIASDSSTKNHDLETSIKLIMEEAYFEGQRDALEGDIRLLQVKDTLNDSVKWVWVKSPWDDGTPPVFKP